MSDAAMRGRQDMAEPLQALSSVPAAVGLTFCASVHHIGRFISSFLVQTPVGAAYVTLVEMTNHLFLSGEKRGLNQGQL